MESDKVVRGLLGRIDRMVQKIQYNSPVVLTFTLLSFLALILNIYTEGKANILFFSVYKSSFTDPLTYVRLFTHVIGHANFEHFFNNFLIILLVGPFLEEKYGSKKLLMMIVATALITGLIHSIISTNTLLLGASGIVFMMMLLSSFVNLKQGKIPLTLILSVVVFLGREVMSGFLIEDNISRTTHVIGGFLGASFGFAFNKEKLTESEEIISGKDIGDLDGSDTTPSHDKQPK